MGRRQEGNMQQKVRMEPEDKPKERYDVKQQTGCPLCYSTFGTRFDIPHSRPQSAKCHP